MVNVLSGGNADSLIVDENEGGAGQGDYEVVVAVVELAHWGKHGNNLPWLMADGMFAGSLTWVIEKRNQAFH